MSTFDETTLPPVVRLRHHLQLRVIDGEGAFLVSERGIVLLEGPLGVALATRLDGTRAPHDIVCELTEEYPADRVRYALDKLVAAGYAVIEQPFPKNALASDATFYEMGSIDLPTAVQRLASATVAVQAVGDVDCGDAIEHLERSGVGSIIRSVGPTNEVSGVTLWFVLTDDYLRPELELLNRVALTTGTPWLLTRPIGSTIWVGPLFRPNFTACWSCLATRMRANREVESYLQRGLGNAEPIVLSKVRHRVGSAVGAGLAALEVLKVITAITSGEPSIVTTDLLTGDSNRHYLIRRPQCQECGDRTLMAARALKPVTFYPRAKVPGRDGGHRAISPEAMVEHFTRQVSPITGVVTSLSRIPITASTIWVFSSGQNLAHQPADLQALRRGLRASSSGKGMSEIQARASAIGEAIERSSGVFQGDELRRRAKLAELGDDGIHPNDCMLFSDRQYEHRQLWNLGASGFATVFDPFDEDEIIEWSPVWSITNHRTRWLPTQYLYYGYPIDGGRIFAYADSNGCASGTSLEDAAVQGFCELVERDSVALWWYNRVRRPGLDLDSFKDPYIERLREVYTGLGREIWALDLTTDIGVPSVGAFSRSTNAEAENILIAFGTHLDPRVAVTRALTEMNQFLPAVLPRADGSPAVEFPDTAFETWCRTASVANQPYLLPASQAARTASTWSNQSTDDFATDLAHCQSLVETRGLELLVLDQTRPDIDLPVVKVIVPGLRHFWPRFAPGRLYDVPVELGWCPYMTEEHLLNPVPVFI